MRNIVTAIADSAAALTDVAPIAAERIENFENYAEYIEANRATPEQLARQRSSKLRPAPLISAAMTCLGAADSAIDATVFSLIAQTYVDWELCAAFELTQSGLERFSDVPNMRIVLMDGSEAELIKAAQAELRGDYFLYLKPGDRLAPDALYAMVQALQSNPYADAIFADEDRIDAQNRRHMPSFKPDLSRYALMCYNCIGRPLLVSRAVHNLAGGYIGATAADYYEYTIKCIQKTDQAVHIARILLTAQDAAPGDESNEKYAIEDMKRRIDATLGKHNRKGLCLHGMVDSTLRIRYSLKEPSVGIVIPNADSFETLRRCVESITMQSSFDCYRIFIADNPNARDELRRYLDLLKRNKVASIVPNDETLQRPAIMNECARYAVSDLILFIDGNAEILTADFIEQMAGIAVRKGVGAVGGKLIDASNNIISAGLVIGMQGWCDSPYAGTPDDSSDWLKASFTSVQRDVSAVSGAFMMLKGEAFFSAGLFDETFTDVGYDTELCIRLMRRQFTNVFTPYAAAQLNGGLASYSGAPKANLLRCYDAYRQTLLGADRYYNFNYDYSQPIPKLSVNPYPPIQLNPFFG